MTRCGSPAWIAPEIMLGDAYDQQVDVYAFGLVAWEVVMRQRPFHNAANGIVQLMRKVVAGLRPDFPQTWPLLSAHCRGNELGALYERYTMIAQMCWSADPQLRPAMADVAPQF